MDDNVNVAEVNANFSQIDDTLGTLTTLRMGSYVGTGTYGSANKCTLTFDFAPTFVIILGTSATCEVMQIFGFGDSDEHRAYCRYSDSSFGRNWIQWDGCTVTWYCDYGGNAVSSSSSGAGSYGQANYKNITYHYFYF
jgi:hypothetical protein